MQTLRARLSRRYAALAQPLYKSHHFLVCLTVFFFLGLQSGVWDVLLADLVAAVNIRSSQLGVALTSMAAAGILSLAFGGKLTDVLARRIILILSILGTALFFAVLGRVDTYLQLLAAFVFGGLCISFFDLIANTLGGDFEQQHTLQRLTFFHAGWSLGAALGALSSGAILSAGVAYTDLLTGLAVLLSFVGFAGFSVPLPVQSRTEPGEASGGRILAVRGVLLAALLIISTFAIDAALEGYISLYLRRLVGSGVFLGGVSVALLYGAAVLGRLVSGAAIARFGGRRVMFVSGGLTLLGLVLVTVFTATLPVAVGLLLVGLALSPLAPLAYSQATKAAPGRVGQAASAVTVFGYGAFLVTPLVIGGVADLLSLRVSFVLLLLPAMCILAVSRANKLG